MLSALPSLSQPRHPKANSSIIACSSRPNSDCLFESQPGCSGSSPLVMLRLGKERGSGSPSRTTGFCRISAALLQLRFGGIECSEQRRRARAQIRSGRCATCPRERGARKRRCPESELAREAGFAFPCRLPPATSQRKRRARDRYPPGYKGERELLSPGVIKVARKPASSSMPLAGTIRTIVFSKGICDAGAEDMAAL